MEGMSMAPPPSSPSSSSSMNGTTGMRHKMRMHMTFYWGSNAEILFNHWPGDSTPMFVLALFLVFFLSLVVEWLPHSRFIKPTGSNRLASGLVQTLIHAIRVGLAYLVMLALMSFNVAVLLVAVAGHAVGFFFFASRAFHESDYQKQFDLPPITC